MLPRVGPVRRPRIPARIPTRIPGPGRIPVSVRIPPRRPGWVHLPPMRVPGGVTTTMRVRVPAVRVPTVRVPAVRVPTVRVPTVRVPTVRVPARWPLRFDPDPPTPSPPTPDPDVTVRLQRAGRAYRAVAWAVKPALRVWFPVTVHGRQHVPAHGPVILAANHRSNADPPLVALVTDRPVFFMAKSGLFRGPAGTILRGIGQFPVRRQGTDRQALVAAQQVVDSHGVLGLFPEGARGAGDFATIHPGLAYILVRTGCPVLPVAVFGTEQVRRPRGWLPRATRVRVVVGPPLTLPDPEPGQPRHRGAARRQATDALRQALQAFLAAQQPAWPREKDHDT